MDPTRSSHSYPLHPATNPYTTSSSTEGRNISTSDSPPLPSLPSIHHLHPGLPPINMSHHPMATSSAYAQTSGYPVPGSSSGIGSRQIHSDSDPDDDPPGPPKKKRRRQALSCTECKRRKIKCDRAQPCGPCSRRGEQTKCQWHIIEPMEKYVTRAEYDELRARFDQLESAVSRMVPGFLPSVSPHHRTMSPGLPVVPTSAVDSAQATMMTPYHTHGNSPPTGYRGMPSSNREPLPPSNTVPLPALPSSPLAQHRSPAGYHGNVRPLSSIPSRYASSSRAISTSPTLTSSSRLNDTRAPISRRASLSLAAITTPFTPDSAPYGNQSKNHRAQTLPQLGGRLRQALAFTGPAQGIRRRAFQCTLTTEIGQVAQTEDLFPSLRHLLLSQGMWVTSIKRTLHRHCLRRHMSLAHLATAIMVVLLESLLRKKFIRDPLTDNLSLCKNIADGKIAPCAASGGAARWISNRVVK